MLYIVKRVTGLDRNADGRPSSVSFENYFGKKFCLSCPRSTAQSSVLLINADSSATAASLPVLDMYTAIKRKTPVSGEIYIDWDKESKAVSWREARKILRKLRRHMIGQGAEQQAIYEELLHITKQEGRG